jgi:beta-N-acetylhexosaminidase
VSKRSEGKEDNAVEMIGMREITADEAAEVWTRACGEEFALDARALRFNMRAPLGADMDGRAAIVDGKIAGMVMASVLNGRPDVVPDEMGWLDALVVAPEYQGRGIGTEMSYWAAEWLRARGRTVIRLGGGLRPFAPGVADEWKVEFFCKQGFVPRAENPIVRDFGHDLGEYASPAFLRKLDVSCRPAKEDDVERLREFLAREFPGRWQYEFEQHLRDGGRAADWMLLESERGLDACCVTTTEESVRPVARFFPSPLPRPWGQVGAIGVSADRRNVGYGSALLDASLRHLRKRGVRGCIIDWTHHVGYYERFGFRGHRRYGVMVLPKVS